MTRKPTTTTGIESWAIEKMFGGRGRCGITLSLYHGWHATDHFAPLQDEALEAAKTVGKRVYKNPSFYCPGQLRVLTYRAGRGGWLVPQFLF